MNLTLKGVLPVLHMPYRDDYTIDYDVLRAEIDTVYEQGADGIVFALASELLRLTHEERRQVTAFLAEANQGRGSMTISVGAESAFVAVTFARHAEAVGATALMATPPLCARAGEAELFRYYEAILQSVALPLVVQDASAYVGQPMTTAFQASLFAAFGDRVGFKPEAAPVGPVISALRQATQNGAKIYEGSGGAMLVENYRRGIAGTMPGSDLLDGIVALWRALESGDDATVYALSPLIAAILSFASGLDGFLAIEKHLLARRGLFPNALVRGPVGFALDAVITQEIERLFDRMQAVLRDR